MNGRTAFVYGYPIKHSISPAIHSAAFAARGLPVRYAACEVGAADLPGAVADLRAPDVLGANVTVPHKQAVLELVDEVDEVAATIGAANTIVNRAGRLYATNTDAAGFTRSLLEAGLEPRGRKVLLLGAGGAARAVGQALLAAGAARLEVANRGLERAELLVGALGQRFPAACLRALRLGSLDPAAVEPDTLLVNTTTVGLESDEAPLDASLLPAGCAVVDIIYNPPRTRLLREAERAGLPTLNGLPMLVHQAAAAWEIWMGQPAPLDVMLAAARSALGLEEQPV